MTQRGSETRRVVEGDERIGAEVAEFRDIVGSRVLLIRVSYLWIESDWKENRQT